MDANGLRRKDTTKGPPLRILSLGMSAPRQPEQPRPASCRAHRIDGGGVRGYSIFIILQEIMHRTFVEIEGRAPRRSEIPKPADHFDLILGTGTGGLIALMLGRLRLDLETCKELYVTMTRMVFQTDKTFLGIPTRPTLFKASLLEQAIKEAVREHTRDGDEGNDGTQAVNPLSAAARSSAAGSSPRRHSSNASVASFSARSPATQFARPIYGGRGGGDPEARLYDSRENRTKTAVTAMYKGTPKGGEPAILRSYDSRREPPPEFDCKIWQAGRATAAVGLAFKPIQIGQSVFHDDGGGDFNPAIQALDEAVVNEWPGREVGVFVSVGTGKRPKGSDSNQAMWYEGFLGEFAEARRRLIAKIEGCEKTHELVRKEHLLKRGVNVENYYRFNVEVGVGEFGMNEWNRLADISTSTKQYLARPHERQAVQSAAAKMAKIHRANVRHASSSSDRWSGVPEVKETMTEDIPMPFAVELPGDMPTALPVINTPSSRQSYDSGSDYLNAPAITPSPRSSNERIRPVSMPAPPPHPPPHPPISAGGGGSPPTRLAQTARPSSPPSARLDEDRLLVTAPTPAQWRNASGQDKIAIMGPDEHPLQPPPPPPSKQAPPVPNAGAGGGYRIEAPPVPPKTPLPETQMGAGPPLANKHRPPVPSGGGGLPYPLDDEEEPPPVNMARKPEYRGR
ncbi:uncharacterized protein E0L32_006327 [Thyridium curvatum]|uniref:PNPLA domain-containing protein n=1 Tax=Thyridium curvatum TaxID=1093900 RepID=A0A507B3P6_9PEZI|nr:uncharacterized protein E0L32_006327 [Thyridium curvatum]TPX13354.1 hypothetical protein E0L32_006327 [Thyridium curvatum]